MATTLVGGGGAAHVAGEDADTGGRVNRFPQSSGFFVEAASGV